MTVKNEKFRLPSERIYLRKYDRRIDIYNRLYTVEIEVCKTKGKRPITKGEFELETLYNDVREYALTSYDSEETFRDGVGNCIKAQIENAFWDDNSGEINRLDVANNSDVIDAIRYGVF